MQKTLSKQKFCSNQKCFRNLWGETALILFDIECCSLIFNSLVRTLINIFFYSFKIIAGQYPGLCGLFVSGIFSASLSTISSAVSSLSAVTLEDYLKPLYKQMFKRPMTDTSTTLPTKIMACLYGIVCIGLAFAAGSMGGVLQASLTIFGVVGGPLLAVFTLGMCTTRANQRGVLLGIMWFTICILDWFWWSKTSTSYFAFIR